MLDRDHPLRPEAARDMGMRSTSDSFMVLLRWGTQQRTSAGMIGGSGQRSKGGLRKNASKWTGVQHDPHWEHYDPVPRRLGLS